MKSAWTHIFETLAYAGAGDLEITAETIKQCGKTWLGKANQFEPRLLCYQSSDRDRPEIFKQYGLCILPIKNGTYLLTKNNIYSKLDYSQIGEKIFARDTSSTILSLGKSETSLIDNMRYSGIFEYILEEPITHGPLLNGRHRISIPSMKLGEKTISISGVQYETDACFETLNKILIIECKASAKEIPSFNIRQLFFPYTAVRQHNNHHKEIVCAFIHEISNQIHVWTYDFTDPLAMESIELKKKFIFKII
jgi:hypothetical protein